MAGLRIRKVALVKIRAMLLQSFADTRPPSKVAQLLICDGMAGRVAGTVHVKVARRRHDQVGSGLSACLVGISASGVACPVHIIGDCM